MITFQNVSFEAQAKNFEPQLMKSPNVTASKIYVRALIFVNLLNNLDWG